MVSRARRWLLVLVLAVTAGEPAEEDATTAPDADDVVLTQTITVTNDGISQPVLLQMRRSQDAAAAVILFAESVNVRDADSGLNLAKTVNTAAASLEPPFEPPSELRLRTAGAHKKKAEELAKDGDHDLAAMHLLRALLRPGLDDEMVAQLKRQYDTAMAKLVTQRKMEAQEAQEAAAAEARRVAEAAALVEARARAERDEADWRVYMAQFASAAAAEAEEAAPVLSLPISLRRGGEATASEELELHVRAGQDAAHAVYHFCSAQGLHSADEVTKLGSMVEQQRAARGVELAGGAAADAAAALDRGTKHRREGAHGEAGVHFARALQHPEAASQLSAEQMRDARDGVVAMMQADRAYAPFFDAVRAEKWEAGLKALEAIPREQRSGAPQVQLLEARCNQKLGKWGNVQRAAARVVEATASYSTWERGQPRMLAVALGTAAALELGDGKKALGFLSSVLKYDPDQSEVRKQYKQLKEVLKLMEGAEEQLVKGYNHKASRRARSSHAFITRLAGWLWRL